MALYTNEQLDYERSIGLELSDAENEAYNDEVSEWAEKNCPELDLSDCDDWEQACIDYDDYCRSLHEDCELV